MMFKMAQIKSWTVSDALWSKIEPLVPARKRQPGRTYRRKPGAGRKRMPARQVFSAIVYVLRTGCQWKALPKEFGSSSAVHAYFQRWQREGFFLKIWKAGLTAFAEQFERAAHLRMEGDDIAKHAPGVAASTALTANGLMAESTPSAVAK